MFFRRQSKWILLLFCSWAYQVSAQESEQSSPDFLVQPNKCVALNQGRECFTKINISWHQVHKKDYCLFLQILDEQPRLLQCWDSANNALWEYEFQSATDGRFYLMEKSSNKVISSALVQVSWLYKANARKRRWRLF